jgi:hypothetical protein
MPVTKVNYRNSKPKLFRISFNLCRPDKDSADATLLLECSDQSPGTLICCEL